MKQLFKKAAVFTDIHYGKRSDSEQHNQDCDEFIDWFCSQVEELNCDTIIMMGDFLDNRTKIGVHTLHYAWQGITKLSKAVDNIYWIIGNHDLFFKSNRSVHSLPFLSEFDNIHVINDITEIDDVLFCPWLVGVEPLQVPTHKTKYVFGHFELPLFLLNEMVEMPDRGGLHADHFHQTDMVFSGHFHKRQLKINKNGIPVWYIGNTFPHDFNDNGDRERGFMTLEWGKEPVFINWMDAPNYTRVPLSRLFEMIENEELMNNFNSKSVIECKDDVNIPLEDLLGIKEDIQEYVRDVRMIPSTSDIDIGDESDVDDTEENIETVVIDHLMKIDTHGEPIDPLLLVKLFQGEQ